MGTLFKLQMDAVAARVGVNIHTLFRESVKSAEYSIRFGSGVTGAPGQPVDSEELRLSWKTDMLTPEHATVTSDCEWAPQNEDGIARPGGGSYNLRSFVGGRWSIAKTVAGWGSLVTAEAARVFRNGKADS
jgi:hypothetical protein